MSSEKKPRYDTLFRPEVSVAKQNTWLGEIQLSRPISFTLLTATAAAVAALLIILLWFGHYTKKTSATGYVTTDKGVITVSARTSGTLIELRASEGTRVTKGDILALLDVDVSTLRGPQHLESGAHLSEKRRLLEADVAGLQASHQKEVFAKRNRQQFLSLELSSVEKQITNQLARIEIVEASLAKYRKMREDGFISELGFQDRTKELLNDKNSLESLYRSKTSLERESQSIATELELLTLQLATDKRKIDASFAQLSIEEIQIDGRRQLAIIAPTDGIVSGTLVSVGKSIKENQSILSIIPRGAELQVDLYVPSKSAAHLKPGVRVALQYRAFPYEKFGMRFGTVVSTSANAVPASDLPYPATPGELYFLVSVRPSNSESQIPDHAIELKPGMAVDARIQLETRRILSWILDPFDRLTKNL